MLRLALLIRSLETGGAQRQLVQLASELVRRGIVVKVFTFYDGGPFWQALRDADVPVWSAQKQGRWDVAFSHRLAKEIRGFKPDVVYSFMTTPRR